MVAALPSSGKATVYSVVAALKEKALNLPVFGLYEYIFSVVPLAFFASERSDKYLCGAVDVTLSGTSAIAGSVVHGRHRANTKSKQTSCFIIRFLCFIFAPSFVCSSSFYLSFNSFFRNRRRHNTAS